MSPIAASTAAGSGGVEGSLPLLAVVAVAGVGTGALFLVSLLAYRRRRSPQYRLISLAVGALLESLSAGTAAAATPDLLALTPNGAFRGLVFEHVIGVAFAPETDFVPTGRALASLAGWTFGGAVGGGASLALSRRVDAAIERVRSDG